MFPASTSVEEAGFTLLEMMVAIAIIALVLAAVPMLRAQLIPSYELRQFANDVANEARLARQRARLTGETEHLILRPDERELKIDGKKLFVPKGATAILTADASLGISDENQVSFYASGAISGGVLLLERENVEVAVNFDWLSGAIRVDQ